MSDPKDLYFEKRLPVDEQQELKVFEVLFKTWFAPLCRAVDRMVKDKNLSEDLVQDVFVKAWNNRSKLDYSFPLKPYLFKAAFHTALNHLESRKNKFPILETEKAADQETSVSIDQQVQFKELEQVLEQSIDLLPPKCKAVFLLIKYEDMSYAEAAESLGISVKTVENQMGKALKHVREHMREYVGYLLNLYLFSSI